MGIQKDLEKAKNELIAVKKLIEKAEVANAKKALETIEKNIAATEKANAEKRKKAEELIAKLADAVNAVLDVVAKKPFQEKKAVDLIKQATTLVVAAVQDAKP